MQPFYQRRRSYPDWFFNTNLEVQYMLLPRLPALAEPTCSLSEKKDRDNFLKRMTYQTKLFDPEKRTYDEKDLTFELKQTSILLILESQNIVFPLFPKQPVYETAL